MSEHQQSHRPGPACPMCMGETDVKQVHREPAGELIVYKCRTCEVEYPVASRALSAHNSGNCLPIAVHHLVERPRLEMFKALLELHRGVLHVGVAEAADVRRDVDVRQFP